jgi:hypothetical protein
MKNYRYAGILLILVVMAAVSLAGCTGSSPVATPTPGASTTATGTATASATTGTATLNSLVDFSKVNWFQYRITSNSTGQPMVMTMKSELSVPYKTESNAQHVNIHSESNSDQGLSVMDIDAYNTKDGKSLGGHMKMTMGGTVVMDQDFAADNSNTVTTYTSQNPVIGASQNTDTLKAAGTESVTVPAGTYNCNKYVSESAGNGAQVWINSGVPVPIKWAGIENNKPTYTVELMGWG